MKNKKVVLRWSKTERDWVATYPEWENRNARILSLNFITMISEFQKFMQVNFREQISNCGFNPDTFTIQVKAKKKEGDK